MSLSECNTALGAATPTLTPTVQSRPHHAPYHHHLRPPDVEEALSSMLWTPYERTSNTPPVSSTEDEEDEDDEQKQEEKAADPDEAVRLNRKLRKSQSSYEPTLSQLLPPPAHLVLPVPFSKSSDERRRQRNRYSYPASYSPSPSSNSASASAYYGSPAHTLTQWCSSAATAIKEPPSYESLYEATVSGVGVARASLARVQPINLQCDRSQRSRTASTTTATQHVDSVENDNDNEGEHNDDDDNDSDNKVCDGDDGQQKLTANVPTERLMRSFTDDYISQVSSQSDYLSILYSILIGN